MDHLHRAFRGEIIIDPFEVSLDNPDLNPYKLLTAIIDFKTMKKDPLCKEATPLMAAINVGCLGLVRCLIKEDADVNQGSTADGSGPLSWALQKKRYEIASLLIRSGADLKSPNSEGFTPMYYAIDKDSPLSIVQDFIDHGVAADGSICNNVSSNIGGKFPIWKAIKENNIPVVKFLLEQSVPINFTLTDVPKIGNCTKMSALTIAVVCNSIESVELLIKHGAKIDGYDDEYPTPLHASIWNEDVRYIQTLISAGADIHKVYKAEIYTRFFMAKSLKGSTNEPDLSVLQLAALSERYDAAKELLNAGADINKATLVTKKTPLNLVCALVSVESVASQTKMVKLFLDNGADMYTRDRFNCSPALNCLNQQRYKAIEEMLYAGLDVNADIGELGSLLVYATVKEAPNIVKLCLEHGGDIKHRINDSLTAYEEAIRRSLHNTVKLFFPYYPVDGVCVCAKHCYSLRDYSPMFKTQYLYFDGIKRNKEGKVITAIDNGADPKAFLTNMRFPIFRPVSSKNCIMLRTLLNRGVNPNVQNNKKETPVHIAAQKCFTEGCYDLLQNGACYNAKSAARQTPLKVAARREVIQLLKEIQRLFRKAKKGDVNSFTHMFNHVPDVDFFCYINCVNRRGNTVMGEAICSGSFQVAEAVMALRLKRGN